MKDVQACKEELASIIDGGSLDAIKDARLMTEHFCAVLSARDLDQLETGLQNELAARQEVYTLTEDMNKHDRALWVLGEALKVLRSRTMGP
jgi:hypothetical protein